MKGRRVFVSVIAVLAALLAVEVLLRAYFSVRTNYDIEMWKYTLQLKQATSDERSHIHRPSRSARLMNVDVAINSHGLRDRETPYEKPAGSYRLLAVGDSVTFGWGVPLEEIAAKRIESVLAARGPVDVVNMGVGNYNTAQELAQFLVEGVRYQPDAVLLFYHITDAEPTQKTLPGGFGESIVAAFLSQRWAQLRAMLLPGANYVDYYRALYAGPGWDETRARLQRFADEARQRNILLIPVILPEIRRLQDYPFGEMHRLVTAAFAEKGVSVIDLLPTFRGLPPDDVMVAPDDPHQNAKGHRLIAEAVLEKLMPELRAKGVIR